MWRPAPSGDPTFEEVALRVSESGTLDELYEPWALATSDSFAERVALDRIVARIVEVWGVPVGVPFRKVARLDEVEPKWWTALDRGFAERRSRR